MFLVLACAGGPVVIGGTGGGTTDPPADSAEDSGTVLPGDSTPPDTADTAPEDTGTWAPGTPDVIVDCTGAGDFTTITAAIAAERSGTHIGVRPCTYAEDIDFIGKSLDIYGIEGPETTIIDGSGRGAVVTAQDGESLGTRLAGVTITGGGGDGYASAVRLERSFLRLENVNITGNGRAYSALYGDGIFLELIGVRFTDNTAARGQGGVLTIDNGTLLAEGLEVDCNGADYAYYEHNSSLVVDSSLSCSGGYGVYVAGGEVQLIRSRVEASLAVYGEDNDDTRNERMWLYNSVLVGSQTAVQAKYMHVKADHSVFWGSRVGIDLSRAHIDSYVTNSVGVGSSCGIRTDGESALFGWNSLENNNNSCAPDAYGTVGGDPGFENAPDDMHLSASSPLRDAGDPDHDQDDDDGTRSDIGAYGGPEAD